MIRKLLPLAFVVAVLAVPAGAAASLPVAAAHPPYDVYPVFGPRDRVF
jgi:hypothetical protein